MLTWESFYKLSNELDEEGYTLFFKKDDEYYAADEENRILFAKIKANDVEDLPKKLDEDVFFLAKNLSTSKKDDPKVTKFSKKDISKIKVCDKKEIVKFLAKKK
jgi:hypothetical protein